MIQIHPVIRYAERSPYDGGILIPQKMLWQGIHTCVDTRCSKTGNTIIADMPVGHAVLNPCAIDLTAKTLYCPPEVTSWLGKPLLDSLLQPCDDDISFRVERRSEYRKVVILNCIDHLYGHALLKLLNVERHLRENPEIGIVVLIQDFLQWLVPDTVAEVWSVHIPLGKAMRFYRQLDRSVAAECTRYDEVYVSKAYSHPAVIDITRYTRIERHNDDAEEYRITFIWRNDRPWTSNPKLIAMAKRLGFLRLLLEVQNRKIVRLFSRLRTVLPNARYTVAGIGNTTTFPGWIDDRRVTDLNEQVERSLCTVYAESRVVIGVHGSSMLLPSAHAGMSVDLMPKERWGNFGQDIIYQEPDTRISSFRHRFFPITTGIALLTHSIGMQIRELRYFKQQRIV